MHALLAWPAGGNAMTSAADLKGMNPTVWLTLSMHERSVSVYGPGSGRVGSVRAVSASAAVSTGGAEVGLDADGARGFIDRMCAAVHYWPENPSLDAHRAKLRDLADELRELRANGPSPDAELADLALARHAGQLLADAAGLIYTYRAHMANYAVAGIAAELVGMLDAMISGPALTNPEERIRAHKARIDDLADHLPTPGATP
jgi:hypothetical protein